MLITWNRALSFRYRDPIVGRHIVIGVAVGCFWAMITAGERALVGTLRWDARGTLLDERIAERLLGGRVALASYLDAMPTAIFHALLFMLLLAVLRAVVHRPWLAAALAGVIILPIVIPRGVHAATAWPILGIGGVGVCIWAMLRFGLVTLVVALFVQSTLNVSPITLDPRVWYADLTLFALAIVAAITTYGLICTHRAAPTR
jgi:hypothetical protein